MTAWKELIDGIRALNGSAAIVPDPDPARLRVQITDPSSKRQATIDFVQPPDMIIHFDDIGISASGGTSAFGIEMARLADGRFDLMRRRKQLRPDELAQFLALWLEDGSTR